MNNANNNSTFTMNQFSTDLIVECILQHIEIPLMLPHKSYPLINCTDDFVNSLRRWVKLTETLVTCLRSDLKRIDLVKSHIKDESPVEESSYSHRKIAAKIICVWINDIHALKTLYLQNFHGNVKDERLQKEMDTIYIYLDYICEMGDYIFEREKVSDQQRNGVVFVFDDSNSVVSALS